MTRDAETLLAAARAARAAGPGPEREELRTAYLELLKLCLCDLAGTTTQSVGALPGGVVMSRELRGEARRLRAAGMDWPLQGLTMIGLRRLDDLQACVEAVVRDGVPGDLIEAGAWRGGASMLMRATLDSLGERRTVLAADSFQGFPAGAPDELDSFDFLAVPVDEVRESFARLGLDAGVEFVSGFFEESLAGLSGRPWSLLRIDADTYEPTRAALDALYPGLAPGGYVVLDDYGSFEGCRRAVDEFRAEHSIAEPIEPIDFTGARWRCEDAAPIAVKPRGGGTTAPRPMERARSTHIPTAAELELARERDALRERLAAAEAQIGLRPWLRRRLRRAR
jgi:macrocin-O-methyltransferase TylF-like protien